MLAILLGASTFPNAPNLAEGRAFYISAADLKDYLCDEPGLALPRRNVLSLFDDSRSPSDQLMEVANFLARRTLELKSEGLRAEDLLIYYVGHGLFTRGDQAYCLAIRSTNEINEGATSIRAGDLAGVIRENAAFLRRYLILDCCFAASIHKEFQSGALGAARVQISSEFPERGTALLCSSNAYEPSLAPEGLEHTMFSDALIKALRQGHEAAGPRLSFSDLGDLIKENLRSAYPERWVRPEVHSPDQREGDIAHIPLFPNPAYLEQEKKQERERSEAVETERAAAERAVEEKAQRERIAKEKARAERIAAEEAAAPLVAAQKKAEEETLAREKAQQERIAREEEEAERAAAQKAAAERTAGRAPERIVVPNVPRLPDAKPSAGMKILAAVALAAIAIGVWAWTQFGRAPKQQPGDLHPITADQGKAVEQKQQAVANPTKPVESPAEVPAVPEPSVPSRFVIGGPADAQTVLDTKTGLMWTRKDYWNVEGTFAVNWSDAMNWVKKMNAAAYGGFSDWSAPTIAQYRTIDGSKGDRAVYAQTFEKTDATDFWATNTPSQYVASYISFTEGYAVSGDKTDPGYRRGSNRPPFPISVRLVRAK